MKRKAIVISVDALVSEDLAYLKNTAALGDIISSSKIFDDVLCIYPTLTYPCHATILTGTSPGRHGIIHNEDFGKGVFPRWLGLSSDIKVKTIFDEARQRGLITSAVSWPVTGGGDIDWLIGEIWPPVTNDVVLEYKKVNSKKGHEVFLDSLWPECSFMNRDIDELTERCTKKILEKEFPDLMLIHFAELDCSRHNNGAETNKNLEALDNVASRIQRIWNTVKIKGMEDVTFLIILGDHGQLNTDHTFSLSSILEEKGYVSFDKEKRLIDYKIYPHSTALSTEVYTKDITEKDAYAVLRNIQEEYPEEISDILTADECRKRYGLYGGFTFMIEGGEGTYFTKNPSYPLIEKTKKGTFMSASHGHMPEKGMKPPFLVYGRGVEKGVEKGMRLQDEAPTIMKLLGISFEGSEGKAMNILEENNE